MRCKRALAWNVDSCGKTEPMLMVAELLVLILLELFVFTVGLVNAGVLIDDLVLK